METPFFFARDNERLFGLLHAPQDNASNTAFIMSHAFAEEKLWSHRVFVSFARVLAERGHTVLRFDYAGAGDSSGSVASATLDSHLGDLGAAVAILRERAPHLDRVALIGLRLGATFAARFCERAAAEGAEGLGNAPLILWDPIIDGQAYFQELLRTNLSTQLAVYGRVLETREALVNKLKEGKTVSIDGYEIGAPLLESCGSVLFGHELLHSGPTLVVQVAPNDKAKDRDDLRSLAESYAHGIFVRTTEQAFWREIKPFYGRAERLYATTLEWLEQQRV